jgi:hypothetical protein
MFQVARRNLAYFLAELNTKPTVLLNNCKKIISDSNWKSNCELHKYEDLDSCICYILPRTYLYSMLNMDINIFIMIGILDNNEVNMQNEYDRYKKEILFYQL